MTSFEGKAVVITGAASGIGEALANAMAAQGARLLICDIDFARLETVAEPLRARGVICLTQVCDVARIADLEALAERARQAAIDLGVVGISILYTWTTRRSL